jgi:nuclear cap-binding protein subunit 1
LSGEHFEVNFDVELQKMSYERQNYGGGNRRRRRGEANKSRINHWFRYNDTSEPDYDYHDRRQEVFETPEQKLRTAIIKLGEVVSLC